MKVIIVVDTEEEQDGLEADKTYLARELGKLIGPTRPIAYRFCQIDLEIALDGFVL